MTVQQMLERDSFEQRHEAGSPISIREFLYCLMQGWDSVMVRADVELGGTDQTFNIGVGRRLMEQEGLEAQVALISPLLEGTDGAAKMSKSLGNCIGITDPPDVMFGMTMRISDALLPKYLRLVSDLPDAEIARWLGPDANPRDAKLALAQALVGRYHDPAAAAEARAAWVRVISEGLEPQDMPEVALPPAPPAGPEPRPDPTAWFAWEIVRACGFAKSSSEARRLVDGGGVTIRGERIAEARAPWKPREGDVVKVGSRRYARLRVAKE
jgi:tyrosyl-tRNA synthetase